MKLKELQKNWEQLGRTDPLWAVLSHQDKKDGQWEINEFFATGEKEVGQVMKYIESLKVEVSRNKALDFGCGVGRLTQPLAHYFNEVYGVDIAPVMIELARKYNERGDQCRYYLNETDDLGLFADNYFDFIYSNITLQHIWPVYAQGYIKEFLRVLARDGLLIFQLPSRLKIINESGRLNLKALILHSVPHLLLDMTYRKLKYGKRGIIEKYGIRRENMVRLLENNGAKIVDIVENQDAGREWVSFRYCVRNNNILPQFEP